jgi:hypothetical protein
VELVLNREPRFEPSFKVILTQELRQPVGEHSA